MPAPTDTQSTMRHNLPESSDIQLFNQYLVLLQLKLSPKMCGVPN